MHWLIIIHYTYPITSVAIIYAAINIPMFVIGGLFVSIRFMLYSLWGMLIYSLMLHIVSYQIDLADPMLASVVAGCLSGIGSAIVLRSYGSTGGADIITVVLNKAFSIRIGVGKMLFNILILSVSTLLFPVEKVLYSIVYAIISMLATSSVFHGMNKREAALIVSEKSREIADTLTAKYQLGVTKLHGRGGYQGSEKMILFSVVRREDISSLKKVALKKDPNAFITVIASEDVTGLQVGNQPHW